MSRVGADHEGERGVRAGSYVLNSLSKICGIMFRVIPPRRYRARGLVAHFEIDDPAQRIDGPAVASGTGAVNRRLQVLHATWLAGSG